MRKRLAIAGAAAVLAGTLGLRAQPASTPQQPVDFTRDIQPIFEKYCYECHGPSKGRARLRLHVPGLVLQGGVSGPVIVPGHSTDSLMIHRVPGLDGEDRILAYLGEHYIEPRGAWMHRARAEKARRRRLEEECECSQLATR